MDNENRDMETEERSMDDASEGQSTDKMKGWIQDNLRIIISVLIVIAIAAGVYSYSKRSEEQLAMDDSQEETAMIEEEVPADVADTEEGITAEETAPEAQAVQEDSVSSQSTSSETEGSFIETAAQGDGMTHLARRALANYLEKNPDSSLTPEHKIYIEDYLRKSVDHAGGVKVGTSVEFSKDMIKDAISKSKGLNERQLNNLKKYSARVSSWN